MGCLGVDLRIDRSGGEPVGAEDSTLARVLQCCVVPEAKRGAQGTRENFARQEEDTYNLTHGGWMGAECCYWS